MIRPSGSWWWSAPMVLTLTLPLWGLAWASSLSDLFNAVGEPVFRDALILSLWTSAASLFVVVSLGTPLAAWLSTAHGLGASWVGALLRAPLFLPPAVVGLALLLLFGRGGPLDGVELAFSSAGVVLVQVIVAAPLYVAGASEALRSIDPTLNQLATTQGWGAGQRLAKVTFPLAAPGLLSAATLAWARALGEFGATLMFAGNLPGVTQTMPLAIYEAMQSDFHVSIAIAVFLAIWAGGCLWAVSWLRRRLPGAGS